MKTKILLSALLSFVFCLLSSQVPQGFNYQAIARDGSGNILANQALPVKISIMADSAGITVYWTELHSTVTSNSFGLITLVVGRGARQSGTALTFDAINWSVTPIFIKTDIYYGDWITMGISRLWSVPYAMRTKDSEQWITSGANIYKPTGNVGIGTTAPSALLDVQTTSNYHFGAFFSTAGASSIGAFNTGFSNWQPLSINPGGQVWFLGPAVGIGTSDPGKRVQIHSNTEDMHLYVSGAAPAIELGNNETFANSTMYGILAMATTTSNYMLNAGDVLLGAYGNLRGNIYINSNYSGAGTKNIIMQPNTGNVGIGTTAPAYKLQVMGQTRISDALLVDGLIRAGGYQSGSNLGSYNIELGGPSPTAISGQATIFFHHHGAIAHQFRYTAGTLYLEAAGNGYGTSATPALQVNGPLYAAVNGGNVGIGTTTSTSKVAIQPESGWSDNVPLFEVKNKYGIDVLAVYNTGVRIQVQHDDTKGIRGGFSVGGYDMTKAGPTSDFMIISPDSIRFNISNTNSKGKKGGFAVGGYDETKGINQDFMYLTPLGASSTKGEYNTFMGYEAGKYAKGPHNTYVGVGAGKGLTSNGAASNIFIGEGAGLKNSGGYTSYPLFIPGGGTITVFNSWGGENIAVGNYTGVGLTGDFLHTTYGQRNVLMGHYSGFNLTTGSYNVFLGYNSGRSMISGKKNVFIGYEAGYSETGSNKLYIANSSTTTPLIYGDFDLGYVLVNGSMSIGTASPSYFLDVNGDVASRSANAFRMRGPTYSTIFRQDGTDAWILVTNSGDPDGSFNGFRPFNIHCADGSVTIGTGLNLSGLPGTTSGSYLRIYNDKVYYYSSSIKTKTNIEPLREDFYKILQAQPVSFTDKVSGERNIGYIAEDFDSKGLNNLVIYKNGEPMSLSYELVSLYTLEIIKDQQKAIKDQKQQIEITNQGNQELKSLNQSLQEQVSSLQSRVDKIEAMLADK
jgi:hypothetical protein